MRLGATVATIAASLLVGCVGQVVTGQHRVAPSNDVELGVVYRPAPGTQFSDVAEKTLNVSVYVSGRSSSERAVYLLAREYSVTTSDIDWSINWESPDRGKVKFVVYPPGMGKHDIPAAERSSQGAPIGQITVVRQSPEVFVVVNEEWTVPYRMKEYPRGPWKQ